VHQARKAALRADCRTVADSDANSREIPAGNLKGTK
jgi:hypothetical protein